jgi:urea transport system substrate-binding protein
MLSRRTLWIFPLLALLAAAFFIWQPTVPIPIRIGVLHSLSGTMAASERPLVDALRLAAEEINAAGGLLGRPLELLIADGRSDEAVFAAEAERLIVEEKVSVLFACWTSACRKAVKPIVEKHQHILFYPVQYEGLEQSPNIVYTGAAPNQQIIPGARWALDTFGQRIYLAGSDYIFPRTAHRLIRDLVTASGGTVLAERYRPLGSPDWQAVAEEIKRLKPDVLLNTINGDSNASFFRALKAAGLEHIPVLSFSIAEGELQAMGKALHHPRHYVVWGYFQSLPEPDNQRFVQAFKARFGDDRVTSDPIEASYNGLRLWANAVRELGRSEPRQVNRAIGRQSVPGPSGVVAVDAATRHLWRWVRIAQARPDGQFEPVETSPMAVRPTPFPAYHSRAEWQVRGDDLARRAPSNASATDAQKAADQP